MRIIFSALSLLVVLGIVAVLGVKQLRAPGKVVAPMDAAAAHGAAPLPPAAISQHVADDVARALQQGADRNAGASQ